MDNTFFSMEMGYEKENIIIDDETYPFTVFLSVDDSYNLIGALK